MKSINFQRNKGIIRVVNEEKIRKSRNWDRVIYIALLIVFLLLILYYIIHKYFFVSANGQVLLESLNIRLADDARIYDFKVDEGDSIHINDTLFAYASVLNNNSGNYGSNPMSATSTGDDNWWRKEIYNLNKKISINLTDINKNKQLIENYRSELTRLTNEAILDALPKARLEQLKVEITRLSAENEKLENENMQLKGMIGSVPHTSSTYKSNVHYYGGGGSSKSKKNKNEVKYNFSGEYLSPPKFFLSPIEGVVTRLHISPYETALKDESIISLNKNYKLLIKVFLEQENVSDVKVGDLFKIEFPDNSESVGVLKQFYFSTFAMPEEFQKKYEPTTRTVAADLYPLNNEEAKKWKAYYKMSVKITKFKY